MDNDNLHILMPHTMTGSELSCYLRRLQERRDRWSITVKHGGPTECLERTGNGDCPITARLAKRYGLFRDIIPLTANPVYAG
jgi:hypothetical protein